MNLQSAEFINGPLDGEIVTIDVDGGPFYIFGTGIHEDGETKENELLVCYKHEEGKLTFVNSKTKEQLLKEYDVR